MVFCYEKSTDEVALVFAEHLEGSNGQYFVGACSSFPQYKVYLEGTQIKMAKGLFLTKKYWKS